MTPFFTFIDQYSSSASNSTAPITPRLHLHTDSSVPIIRLISFDLISTADLISSELRCRWVRREATRFAAVHGCDQSDTTTPPALQASLVVRRTRLSTYGDRTFPVATARVWNCLPHHVTSACFLQSPEDLSFQTQFSLTILLWPRSNTCHHGHINRSYLLTYLLCSDWSQQQPDEMKSVGIRSDETR